MYENIPNPQVSLVKHIIGAKVHRLAAFFLIAVSTAATFSLATQIVPENAISDALYYDQSSVIKKSNAKGAVKGAAITNGLQAYWAFDEGTGTTTADGSSNGKTGTLVGSPSWVTGKIGGALQFSGSKRVNVPDTSLGNSAYTFAAWVKTSGDGWIIGQAESSDFRIVSGKAFSQLYTSAGYKNVSGVTSVTNNAWRHIAITRSGGTVKIYVDGALDKTKSITGTPSGIGFTTLAARDDNGTDGFTGSIDEVYVFNRALSGTEITTLYTTGGTTTPDTTAPTVSITAPASGATVSGTSSSITATASDNIGVVGVQFKLNGVDLGAEDTTAPYSYNWNTTTSSNGTKTLTAVARDAAGNTKTSSSVSVTVSNAVPTAPVISSFSASPTSITAGQSSTLSWSVTGATSLSINQGVGTVTGTSKSVSPASTTTYTLTATNATGSTTATTTVTVGTAPVPVPVISSFSASPTSITAGQSSTLSWSVTGATSLSINQGVGTVTGTSKSVSPASTTTYTLTATNATGSTTATTTVTVTAVTPPTTGLIGHWTFNEGSGSTAADSSGNNNSGTLVGSPSWVGGKSGQALQFASGKSVNVANTYPGNTAYTTAVWVNTTSSDGWIVGQSENSDLRILGGKVLFQIRTSSDYQNTYSNASVNNGQWRHVAVTVSGTTVNIYIDGVLDKTATISSTPTKLGFNTIAARTDNSSEGFTGTLDEVRVYNKALTSAEISALVGTIVTPPGPDTTAPSISITSPTAGAIIGGTALITVSASDNVGVVGVQYKVGNLNMGGEVTSAPFSANFNTASVANGSHTLTAIARDAAGNTKTSAGVTVTVSNVTVPVNTAPTGSLDGVNTTNRTIYGWAHDADNLNAPVLVHLYYDGPTNGTPQVVTANEFRSDVGNHAFNAPIPTQYLNGQNHTVYAYAIDLTDSSGAMNRLLGGSPKTFNITSTIPTAPVISSFSASPTSITAGQSSTLSWSVTGATSLSINQGVGTVTGTSKSVSPASTTTYTLTATNATGSTTATTTVTVGTTQPPAAGCNYYAASHVTSGGNGTFDNPWSFQGGLSSGLITTGKTLCLKAGTYYGKFVSELNGGTITSVPGDKVVIDGYKYSTLRNAMPAGGAGSVITFEVANAADLQPYIVSGGTNGLIIDGETFHSPTFNGNMVTATRTASGSSTGAVSHVAGSKVRLAEGTLRIKSNNTTYSNLEVTNSDPGRNWQVDGAEGIRGACFFITGSGNKIINNTVHDCLNGIFTGSSSSNTEIYGNIVYNNGVFDPADDELGKGHGLYLENASGYLKVHDNIISNNFSLGTQVYGRTACAPGFDIQRNSYGNSGAPLNTRRSRNLVVGPETCKVPYIVLDYNVFYHHHDKNASSVTFGYGAGVDDGRIENNYFVGGGNSAAQLDIYSTNDVSVQNNKFYSKGAPNGVRYAMNNECVQNYAWDRNTYYGSTGHDVFVGCSTGLNFPQWKNTFPTFDRNSTEVSTAMPDTVIVRANAYQPGRANITVIAPSLPNSVSVNLSQAGLSSGQSYKIINAFNWDNSPNANYVATGTYNPSSPNITIPLSGVACTVATPYGSSFTPPSTCKEYATFVVIPTSTSGGSGFAAPTPPSQIVAPPTAPSTPTAPVTLTPGVSNFKYASSATIYFLDSNNMKQAYTEAAVFLAWNSNYNSVVTIPESQTYPDAATSVRLPEGSLVKVSSAPTVYRVEGTTVRPFASLAALTANGGSLSKVITVSVSYLNTHSLGQTIN